MIYRMLSIIRKICILKAKRGLETKICTLFPTYFPKFAVVPKIAVAT